MIGAPGNVVPAALGATRRTSVMRDPDFKVGGMPCIHATFERNVEVFAIESAYARAYPGAMEADAARYASENSAAHSRCRKSRMPQRITKSLASILRMSETRPMRCANTKRRGINRMKKIVKRALMAGALIAGPALINNAIFSRAKALGNTVGGDGRFWPWREGDIFYARKGTGDMPILLLHGIYAGAGVYEWRKNFEPLSEHFEVTALDWLGFGLSDKPHIRYSDTLYIDMLRDFIGEVIGRPCMVVASSLACAYAIEAAAALPDLVESLVLVCPTGFAELSSEAADTAREARYQTMNAPLIGTSLYNAITLRAGIRSYMQSKIYFDPSYVTDEMVDHYSTASHQYGAQYAPLCFLSGELNHSVAGVFASLPQRNIRLVWGRESRQTPLDNAEPFLAANAAAELTVLDKAGILPHDEQRGFQQAGHRHAANSTRANRQQAQTQS